MIFSLSNQKSFLYTVYILVAPRRRLQIIKKKHFCIPNNIMLTFQKIEIQ